MNAALTLTQTDPRACNPRIAGGKGSNLAKLQSAFTVPPFFVVTTEALNLLLQESRWSIPPMSASGLRRAILAAELPAILVKSIGEGWDALQPKLADGPAIIRSSAVDEDQNNASFAGQYKSVLGVDRQQLSAALRACWASAVSDESRAYRQAHGFDSSAPTFAIVAQKQIDAERAGVMFTRHPVSGANEIVIEANFGLGESVLSGQVTPDMFVLSPSGDPILVEVAEKWRMTVPCRGGSRLVEIGSARRSESSLTPEHLYSLSDLAQRVERFMQIPVNIEWCIDAAGEVWLLQARPITAAGHQRSSR